MTAMLTDADGDEVEDVDRGREHAKKDASALGLDRREYLKPKPRGPQAASLVASDNVSYGDNSPIAVVTPGDDS